MKDIVQINPEISRCTNTAGIRIGYSVLDLVYSKTYNIYSQILLKQGME